MLEIVDNNVDSFMALKKVFVCGSKILLYF